MSGILGDVADWLGFGGQDSPKKGTVVPDSGSGSGGFSNTNFYSALLNAGLGLAGNYFSQKGQKELMEMSAEQRMKELAFAAANKGGGGGGGGGGSNAAKMATLASLYNNYAQIMAESQDDERAIQTGQMMQAPLIARAGRL